MNDKNGSQIQPSPPMTIETARLMLVTEASKSARQFLEMLTLSRMHYAEYTIRTIGNQIGMMGVGINAEALEDVGLNIVGYSKLPIGKTETGEPVFEIGLFVKRPRLVGL